MLLLEYKPEYLSQYMTLAAFNTCIAQALRRRDSWYAETAIEHFRFNDISAELKS
jgi:hypothetical protein